MRKRADSALGMQPSKKSASRWRGDAESTNRDSEVISPLLSTQTRLRLKATLRRLAAGYRVSLQEIIDLQTCADRDQTVAAWLRRARHRRSQRTGGASWRSSLAAQTSHDDDPGLDGPFDQDEL